MRTVYAFSVLGRNNRIICQFSFSKGLLLYGVGLLLAGISMVPFFLSHYLHLRGSSQSNIMVLSRTEASNRAVLSQQVKQLDLFASDLRKLKSMLDGLDTMERNVRQVANLGSVGSGDLIFGIGGSIGGNENEQELNRFDTLLFEKRIRRPLETAAAASSRAIPDISVAAIGNRLGKQRNILAAIPTIYPSLGWETSCFGYRHSEWIDGREFHKGLDIAAAKGSPVIAPAHGVVTSVGEKGIWGLTLQVDHGHGLVTRYSHLSRVFPRPGDRVMRGEPIAEIGKTGRCKGPHLHYEVHLNGIQVNPKSYILFAPSFMYEAYKKEFSPEKG